MGECDWKRRYTLVLDAGTSCAKCFVYDDEGRVVGSGRRAWDFVVSGEAYSLAREWEPDALWRATCELIKETVCGSDITRGDIGSVAVTSQRQAVAFLDGEGNTLYAGPNLDLRAFFEGAEIDDAYTDLVYRTTGHLPSFLFVPAKLKWFARHQSEVYKRVSRVLALGDWLAYRLTGEIVNERTLAGEAGLLDIGSGDWCHSLLSELGVMFEIGQLIDAGSVVGSLSSTAAGETMLHEGIPVVAAGADTQCGLLGMGVSCADEIGVVAGWSAPVQMITEAPEYSKDASSWVGRYPVPDRWVAESSAGDLGNAYSWLVNLLCGDAPDGFEAMDAAAGRVSAGSEGVQAIMGSATTRYRSPRMRAGGFVFPVPMTLSELGRGNFARAALESAAYGIRANLDALESVSGRKAKSVALGGGMIRSRTLAPIVADVLGREIGVSQSPDASGLGAWLCSETARGEFATLDDAADWAKERTSAVEPNPHVSAEYQHFYRQWVELAERMDKVSL